MNRNDVIDVLTVISAADRRTVGDADVDVWQAVVGELRRDLAFQAVKGHLREEPDVWLQPGHVYKRARALHRAELEEESNESRIARQTAQEAKAAADVREVVENVTMFERGRRPAFPTPRYWAARDAVDNFPWRNDGRPVDHDTRTPAHQNAARAAIAEYSAALVESRTRAA